MCKRQPVAASVKKTGYVLFCLTIFWHVSGYGEGLIDPTQPPGVHLPGKIAGTKSAPQWVLTSTLIAPARRLATINGKTVSVGERIGGARVMRIEPARVSLRKGTRQIVVQLSPRDFKRMR